MTKASHDEQQRLSPTFAEFAFADTAVRKTRRGAYQKIDCGGTGSDLFQHEGHSRLEPSEVRYIVEHGPIQPTPSKLPTSAPRAKKGSVSSASVPKSTNGTRRRSKSTMAAKTGQGDESNEEYLDEGLGNQRLGSVAAEASTTARILRPRTGAKKASAESEEPQNSPNTPKFPATIAGLVVTGLSTPYRAWHPMRNFDSYAFELVKCMFYEAGMLKATPLVITSLWHKSPYKYHAREKALDLALTTRAEDVQKLPISTFKDLAIECIASTYVAIYRLVYPFEETGGSKVWTSGRRMPRIELFAIEWEQARANILKENEEVWGIPHLRDEGIKLEKDTLDLHPPGGIFADLGKGGQKGFIGAVDRHFPWASQVVRDVEGWNNTDNVTQPTRSKRKKGMCSTTAAQKQVNKRSAAQHLPEGADRKCLGKKL